MQPPDVGDIWRYPTMRNGDEYYLVLKVESSKEFSHCLVTDLLCLGHTASDGDKYVLGYLWDMRYEHWELVD